MKAVVAYLSLALVATSSAFADSIVVFNELMYHPPTNEPAMEWIELYNQNAVDVDIGGFVLSGGVDYTFPSGTRIRGRGYLVVASDPNTLTGSGAVSSALGPFNGRLGNSGDKIVLRDRNNRVMDTINYSSGASWPSAPDGTGVSLAKRDPMQASGLAENWAASLEVGGTPGRRNFPGATFEAPPGLVSFWNFDESGGDARDLAGATPGTLSSGVTRVPGLIGPGAVQLNGTAGSSIQLGRDTTGGFASSGGVTVEAVITPTWSGTGRAAIFRKEPDNRGTLVSYWSFDEASSGTNFVLDLAGGNTGSFRGSTLRTNGILGRGAALFRNSGSEGLNVGVGLSNSFSFTNGLTLAAWIRPLWVGTTNTYDAIFSKDDGANRITFAFQYDSSNSVGLVSVPPGPVLSFGLNIDGTYSELDMPLDGAAGRPTLAQLTNGQPHHVAATFDAASGSLGIWVDGTRRYSATKPGLIRSGGVAPAFIGNRGTSGGQPFTGVIDEVALWSSALSATDIDRLNQRVTPPELAPVTGPGNRLHFGFRQSGDTDFTDPVVLPTPVLFFGLNVGGQYRELELALDGVAGRPTLAALKDGRPHHVAALFDAASQRKAIAVDGKVLASEVLVGGADSSGLGLMSLGNVPSTGVEAFQGTLDEVAFWNRGLTDAELSLHGRHVAGSHSYFSSPTLELPAVSLSELPATSANPYWIEIANWGSAPADLGGLVLARSSGGSYVFPPGTVAAGGFVTVSQASLGFRPKSGDLISLFSPDRSILMDSVRVTPGAQARTAPGTGPWRVPSQSTPGAGNNIALHDEIVINEIMYHAPPVYSQVAQFTNVTLVPIDAPWKYNQDGVDLGTSWAGADFKDASWPEGPALFYNETATLPAAKNTPLKLGPVTYYFRKTLSFAGDPSGVTLFLRPVVDDGAVFYLNGVEILRYNLKTGPVAYTNLATTVNNAVFSGPFTVIPTNLLQGDNLLAVEVHQSATNSDDVVFGVEITAKIPTLPAVPFVANPEQWIELYNRSAKPVDLTGWKFTAGVDYSLPAGTVIQPSGYLVVARDAAALQAKYPSITILGPWSGKLGGSDRIVLADPAGNPADEVRYYPGGRWPEAPDGGGASLELRDPSSDNSRGEAWAASDEQYHSAWRTISYSGVGSQLFTTPGNALYNELVIGLLDSGEVLLDDVIVRDLSVDPSASIIQNSDFEAGLDKWRVIGNHRAEWAVDPDDPSNHVMRMIATGMTEHMNNHAETTVKSGGKFVTLNDGHIYQVSLRARWVSGSPQLNTRLFFNRLARTTVLPMPGGWGTPGARNSRAVDNWGPTYADLSHFPPVPAPAQPVTVGVTASDPQSVAGCMLRWTTNFTDWNEVAMTGGANGRYTGSVPGHPAGTVVQFYIQGVDGLGATSTMPGDGAGSRALYQVADGQDRLGISHNIRIVMTRPETNLLLTRTNLMSNGRIGCTAILDEQDVVYDCGVRLKGSEHGRPQAVRIGFNLDFPPEHLFRGVHQTAALDRSGGGGRYGQDEILINHIVDHAGGVPAMHNDLAWLVGPTPYFTGSVILQMSRYGPLFLDEQFSHGSDNPVFEVEYYYGQSEQIPSGPEGLKVPQEAEVTGNQMQDLGDDKENYRLGFIIKNRRDRDDFESLIPNLKIFSLPQATFVPAAEQRLDIDEWLRCFALGQLCGAGDNYTGSGAGHNVMVYVRPEDGRFIQLIWDMDFAFTQNYSDSLENNGDLGKLLGKAAYKHAYYGHIQDILTTTYNTNYITYWGNHYDNFVTAQEPISRQIAYVRDRAAYARAQLPKQVPFAITSNGGKPFATNSPFALVAGSGWVDVKTIRWDGYSAPSDLTWGTWTNWVARVPLMLGSNVIYFSAYHLNGTYLTNTFATVIGTSLTGGVDSDGDGMPDAWENINGFNPLVADGSGDADGDGFTNLQEYLAGTDPVDSRSRLALRSITPEGGGVRIAFDSVTGRSYAIQYREALDGSPWKTLAAFSAGLSDAVQSAVDPSSASPQRFYRLVTPAP